MPTGLSIRVCPACAGKREGESYGNIVNWDHPRVCGEKLEAAASGYEEMGSPPRVRGKVAGEVPQRRPRGITLACAGNHESDGFTLTTVSIPSPYALPRPRPFTRTWRNSFGSVTVRLPSKVTASSVTGLPPSLPLRKRSH